MIGPKARRPIRPDPQRFAEDYGSGRGRRLARCGSRDDALRDHRHGAAGEV